MSLCLAFASLIPHHVFFTPIVLLGTAVFIIFIEFFTAIHERLSYKVGPNKSRSLFSWGEMGPL